MMKQIVTFRSSANVTWKKTFSKILHKSLQKKRKQISDIPGSATRRSGNAMQITRVSPGQEERWCDHKVHF